jgi:hypothetical protein
MVMHATIDSGKTYQFPVIGQAEAVYHARAESLYDETKNYLNNIEHGERTINVDRPLVSSFFTDNWDQLITHFDTQSVHSTECGLALARKKDKTLAQLIALAARTPATLSSTQSGTKGGLQIATLNMDTSMTALRAGILDAMENLVTKDVPMEELVCVLKPAQFYPLMDEGYFINADYNTANGSRAQGTFDKAYGFRVVMSNHLPNGLNITAETGALNTYSGDFTNTVGLCFHKSCVGAVRRQGVTVESEYSIARQGTLVVAKMIEGYGTLRPECAVELLKT